MIRRALSAALIIAFFVSLFPPAAYAKAAATSPVGNGLESTGPAPSRLTPTQPLTSPEQAQKTIQPPALRSETTGPAADKLEPAQAVVSLEPAQDIGEDGGTVDLPNGAELVVPAGALPARSRFSRYTVEMRLSEDLFRHNPIDQPIHVEARRSDNSSPVTQLQRPATLRLKLDRPDVPRERVQSPAIRILRPAGWELVPSSYDSSSMTITVDLTELPATVAVVDGSKEVGTGDWDPKDPAAVQLGDGSWGVAYYDPIIPGNVKYRRMLGNLAPPYWPDAAPVESGADSPALVKLGSALGIFYRKSDGTKKQVYLKTSTDNGSNWSAATKLTTETVDIYQVQASNVSGTIYLFWSLSDTSGLLQYRTSTDLANWTPKASVGQPIGPLQQNTYPQFDIKRFSSGTWGLTWLNVAACASDDPPCTDLDVEAIDNVGYPVVWYAASNDLAATNWSNKRELTLPYTMRWANGVSIAQASSGTVYVSYSRYSYAWDHYAYFRTSTDDGASWSSRTVYGYEPARGTGGSKGTEARNSYLVVDNSGGVRSFFDQFAASAAGFTDGYPVQLFFRDLPSGAITPIPAAKETLAECGPCQKTTVYGGDPVNLATGNFTLP